MFKRETYLYRKQRLCTQIKSGLILLPGNDVLPYNYADNGYDFRQDSSFLYFFGLSIPGMIGVIDAESGRSILFGNVPTLEEMVWTGPLPTPEELMLISASDEFRPIERCRDYIQEALSQGRDVHFLPPYHAQTKYQISEFLGVGISALRPSTDLIKAVVSLRSIKSDEEISELEKAADLTVRMHLKAMQMAQPGVREQDIVAEMEAVPRHAGGFVSFPTILSMRGEILHNHRHDLILERGRMLLVDAGAETESCYAGDRTRTIPVGGRFTARQKDIYDIVYKATEETISQIRPGVKHWDFHLEACRIIADGLKSMGLMKGDPEEAARAGAVGLFMPHGLGHMIGLDVHDMEGLGEDFVGYDGEITRSLIFGHASLRMARKLEPGHVISNEPGIYFVPGLMDEWMVAKRHKEFVCYDRLEAYRDFGGIRIEDTVLVTGDGCRTLGSPYLPKSSQEVEEYVLGYAG